MLLELFCRSSPVDGLEFYSDALSVICSVDNTLTAAARPSLDSSTIAGHAIFLDAANYVGDDSILMMHYELLR